MGSAEYNANYVRQAELIGLQPELDWVTSRQSLGMFNYTSTQQGLDYVKSQSNVLWQSTLNLVPGKQMMDQAQAAASNGNYGMAAAYGLGSIGDAALGVFTAGESSEIEQFAFKITDAQANALTKLGVNEEDHIPFMNGQTVAFQYPTVGGDDVYGFLQYQNGSLTSQLFSINNTAGGAASAFRHSNGLAASLGLDSIELQGGSVINPDLANALLSRGFVPKIVPVPDALGGGTQEVLSKIVPVKQ